MTPKRCIWSLLALLIILAIPLGCRMATDPAVEFGPGRSIDMTQSVACLRACDEERDRALEAAKEEHRRILLEVCGPLPSPLQQQCRQQENERYQAARELIRQIREKCKIACRYNEGAGRVGR